MEMENVVEAVKEVAAETTEKVIDLPVEAVKSTVTLASVPFMDRTVGKTGLTVKEAGVGGLIFAGGGAAYAGIRWCVKHRPIKRGFNRLMSALGFEKKPKNPTSQAKGEVLINNNQTDTQQPEPAAETESKE